MILNNMFDINIITFDNLPSELANWGEELAKSKAHYKYHNLII